MKKFIYNSKKKIKNNIYLYLDEKKEDINERK